MDTLPYPSIVQLFHINPRMGLMPGHGGDAVIKNNQGKIMVIIDRINQTGYSGMKKGGISDKGNDFFVAALLKIRRICPRKTPMHIRKSPMDKGRQKSQGIAADIRGTNRIHTLGGSFSPHKTWPGESTRHKSWADAAEFREYRKDPAPLAGVYATSKYVARIV